MALDPADFAGLGFRLKTLRKMRGDSLDTVAQAVDVSPSFLSMLERGRTDVSLGRIRRIANFYNVRLSELLLEGEADPQDPVFNDSTEQTLIDRGPGVVYRLIRQDQPQVMHVVIEPQSGFADMAAHQGEDFWLLLRNEADLLYGGRRFPMRALQTVRFSGRTLHAFQNPYPKPAELIAVTTIPYW